MQGFVKIGEAVTISPSDVRQTEHVLADPSVVDNLEKFAANVKTIAPKAKDFLYFAAVMMHAAEASLLDEKGSFRKDASGNEITAMWQKEGDSWRWVCSDPNIKPYKNANNDIFPEEELIKAHKRWVGRPLCLDHRSDSVDHIRGVIVDTYYDYPLKRVIALCALDKKTYPDLAHKVTSRCATAVSMGTAVGRAICSDCGTVARVEADFCDHMRNKSCYGEINIDLKPIELSIVVNGADPQAEIKHVIAAANSISEYIDNKKNLVFKLSEEKPVEPELISTIKTGLDNAMGVLKSLEDKLALLESSGEEIKEAKAEDDKSNESQVKVAKVLDDLNEKINKLQSEVDTLSKQSNEETNMTDKQAYFQGGGGVNEPTPGQPKYEKEDYHTLRDQVDKQMVGQMETGPVEGMHPGYDSYGESEEARKERLQRAAEQEERALRREAAAKAAQEALKSKGYFQGGGGPNEPTPGKAKYEKEDYTKHRDKEDKQMVGQKPFPDVGSVDGLHPSPASADQKDELKRKQMLSRAKLQARFYKAAGPDGQTEDKANSAWHVFANNKLILTATVDEITNGKTDALYESVANKDYGRKILSWVRTKDLGEVKSLLKKAQPAPAPAPKASPDMPEMGEMDEEEGLEDLGGTGSPEEKLPELLDEAENWLADMRESVDALLEGPGSELDEFSEMEMPKAAYYKKMNGLQKKVGKAIAVGMKKLVAELTDQVEELKMAKHIHENKEKVSEKDYSYACKLTEEAIKDTKATLAESYKLAEAFVRYARGTESLIKQAKEDAKGLDKKAQMSEGELYDELTQKELEILDPEAARMRRLDPTRGFDEEEKAELTEPTEPKAPRPPQPAGGTAYKPSPAPKEKERGEGPFGPAPETWAEMKEQRHSMLSPEYVPGSLTGHQPDPKAPAPSGQEADDMGYADDSESDDLETADTASANDKQAADDKDLESEASIEVTDDRSTKEGRAALREKLAQKGLKFSDMLQKAHPKGGETTDLDIKPSGDLAKVERLDEQHAKHMDVALAPPKVRQAAEDIQELVVKGELNPTDDMFKQLIAEGLDPAAVKYWKQFYGQAKDGGKQFATEFTKEHYKKKMAEEMESYRVKIARAYELTNDMVRKGLINNDKSTVDAQVRELMGFNDDGFTSFKRYVERQPTVKKASMPQVGKMASSAEVVLPAPEAKNDLSDALNEAMSQVGLKRRMF